MQDFTPDQIAEAKAFAKRHAPGFLSALEKFEEIPLYAERVTQLQRKADGSLKNVRLEISLPRNDSDIAQGQTTVYCADIGYANRDLPELACYAKLGQEDASGEHGFLGANNDVPLLIVTGYLATRYQGAHKPALLRMMALDSPYAHLERRAPSRSVRENALTP